MTDHFPGKEATLPPLLLTAIAKQEVFDASGNKTALHSNISISEAETLYQVVRELKPTVSAEVGFAQGISAMAILKALSDNNKGSHHVMDPFQQKYDDVGLAMVARAGLDSRLQFHRKFAEEVIPSLPMLQFGFIDSSHLFDHTISEFVMIDRKLEVGGMLAFHDMWMPSLQKFLRYVLANRAYEIVRAFDVTASSQKGSLKQSAKQIFLHFLNVMPRGDQIFREELLHPWSGLDVPNLVVLRKFRTDCREWRYHQSF